MIRDYQRTKVWRAFWEWSPTLKPQPMQIPDIEQLIRRVLSENRNALTIYVDPAKGGKTAHCRIGKERVTFRFPTKHREAWEVCRELAYVVAGLESGHDWYYCRRLLRLVREVIGPHEAASLLAAFQKQGVKLVEHRKEKWKKPFRFSDPANKVFN